MKHARAPANSHSSSRVSRVGAAAGLLRGLRGGARGGAEVPATRGPIWRSVRCAATARDPTPPRRSPSWHGPRHCGRRYRSTVTAGHGAPASAMMIAPAAFRDPVAARVAAAARLGRSGSLPGPSRHARGGEWTSPRGDIAAIRMQGQRRLRPARCPPARARAVPRCVRAVARTEISVLLGAPFPLCLASRTACPSCPLPHASRRARGLRHAYSPRAEKATLQHLQVAGPWHALCLSLPPGPPPPPPPASALT